MIVVAGEALIDLVRESDGRYRALPGGSPANVAVGLARLGQRTELLARISDSAFGRLIRDHLASNGVGLRYAVTATQRATLAVVTRDPGVEPRYDFYFEGTADWAWVDGELPRPLPDDTRALCTGSLALAFEPGATVLDGLLQRERGKVTIVFDPNVRPSVMSGPGHVDAAVRNSDVVKVSEADLAWLVPDEPLESVAERWLGLGPKLVVVTCGERGAYAVAAGGVTVALPAQLVEAADTIGAGDAFTAGMVDALDRRALLGGDSNRLAAVSEDDLRDIIAQAILVATVTCTRPGADPPARDEVASIGGPTPR